MLHESSDWHSSDQWSTWLPISQWHRIYIINSKHTHTLSTAFCLGLPRWAGTRKVKPICILLKQESVSGSGISWAICKSEPRSKQITTPAIHRSVFYRPYALPAAQPTASKHWRHKKTETKLKRFTCKTKLHQLSISESAITMLRHTQQLSADCIPYAVPCPAAVAGPHIHPVPQH